MNSLTFVCALVAALAMSAHGQLVNVTMTMVDVADTNSTMMPSQPDTDMPSMTNDTVTDTDTDTNNTITTSMPDMINMNTTMGMQTVIDDNTTTTTTPMMTSSTIPAETTTTEETTTEEMTTPSPCKQPTGRQDEIYAFTGTVEFTELAASTQIVIYEILAAAEGCKMRNFVTPETTERMFRMLGEIPLRYVYIFVNYMAMALQNEGIIGPS